MKIQFLVGVLVTFTLLAQPELAPMTIPAGNREVVERFARSQVNYAEFWLRQNGNEIDLSLQPYGKREFAGHDVEGEVRLSMDSVIKKYLSNARRLGVAVSPEDEYHFDFSIQARYQAGTGVLDPKGLVIGTDLRDVRSTPFHLQKVGEYVNANNPGWVIPAEGYQFTVDWFRDTEVYIGIPITGITAMDLVLFDGTAYRFREESFKVQPELVLVCSKQLACEINMREDTRAWITLWYDEGAGTRVNYDLRTGSQIPWGHDKVPKLAVRLGRYPGSVFLDLSNLEFGQVYTMVSATSVTDPATNFIGAVRADDYTGEPVSFPVSAEGDHQFFSVRPATQDESRSAQLASAKRALTGN